MSLVAGIAEAAALMLAVRLALKLSTGGSRSFRVPLIDYEVGAALTIAVAAAFAVLAMVCHVVVAEQTARLASGVLACSRRSAVGRFVDAGWPSQAVQREGALQETVTTLAQRTSQAAQALGTLLSQMLSVAMFVITSLVIDPVISGVVVAVGVLIVGLLRPIAKRTRRAAHRFVDANSAYAEDVTRLAGTSMELRVFGVQREAERELESANQAVQRLQFHSRFWALFGSSLYKDLAVLVLIGAVGALALASTGKISGIGVVVTLMVRSLASAQQANNSYQNLNENQSSLDAIRRRIDVLAAGTQLRGRVALTTIDTIELKNVGYSYSADVAALSDVSLTLRFGDALGVVGPSGGGKSTLIQVLLRLRPPTSGQVLVNAIDYRELDDADWAAAVALVPQEPTLFEASVADNIAYYRKLDRAAIEQAARDANVFDDIAGLANGFDTMLGPRGVGLSGGQKQRVAIARALVGKPQLLVLDEPSSALDVRSEQALQRTLAALKGQTTLVVIAHRMKTVEACDRLLVLEHGRMQQLDTAAALIDQDGFYRWIHGQLPA